MGDKEAEEERYRYQLPRSSKRPNGCFEACFRSARDAEDFAVGGAMSDLDVAETLKLNVVGVLMLILFQGFMLSLWMLGSVIPGFALFDGAPSTYSAFTHLGWWLLVDAWCVGMGISSVYFSLNYAPENGKIERGVDRTVTWLRAYQLILIFAALADLFHACLSISELAVCDSTLCRNDRWALISLVVGLFVSAVLQGWIIYRVNVFRDNLRAALAMRRINMDVLEATTAAAVPDSDIKAQIGARATTTTTAKSFAARYGRKQ